MLRAERRRGPARARAPPDEWTARTPDRPRFVAGSIGPTNRTLSISPDVNNPAFRAITFDEVREAYAEQVRGPDRRRLRSPAARDDLRHAQRQGGARRASRRCSRPGAAPAADDLGHDHRPQRPHAVGPDDRRVLGLGRARAAVSVGINCALGAREMRPYLAELARIADTFVSCYPNAGLPNAFGQYDEQPEETAAILREFAAERPRQHRRRLLRHDAGSHRARSRAPSTGCRRAPRPAAPADRAHPLRRPRAADASAPTATSR